MRTALELPGQILSFLFADNPPQARGQVVASLVGRTRALTQQGLCRLALVNHGAHGQVDSSSRHPAHFSDACRRVCGSKFRSRPRTAIVRAG